MLEDSLGFQVIKELLEPLDRHVINEAALGLNSSSKRRLRMQGFARALSRIWVSRHHVHKTFVFPFPY